MNLITKIFKFDSAHLLKNHSGKCKNLHGHSYSMEICLQGEINKETGMIMDFGDLKKIVEKRIIEQVDHNFLNDIFDFVPTAENMAKHFFKILEKEFGQSLYSVSVWETSTCKAEHRG